MLHALGLAGASSTVAFDFSIKKEKKNREEKRIKTVCVTNVYSLSLNCFCFFLLLQKCTVF
jgi:hypothetical protein